MSRQQADGYYEMTLLDAARQAVWDLSQWVKDHPYPCECFTCSESIPDLRDTIAKAEANASHV